MRKDIGAEIRLQGVRFGLSPIDRRRLQWEIEHTEEAQHRGQRCASRLGRRCFRELARS